MSRRESIKKNVKILLIPNFWAALSIYITFRHLAAAFIQSNVQRRTTEAIKTNKRNRHIFLNKKKETIVKSASVKGSSVFFYINKYKENE